MKEKKGLSLLVALTFVISVFWGMDYHTEMVMAAETDEDVLYEDHFDDDTSLSNWTVITSATSLTTDRGFLYHNSTGEVKISTGEDDWQDYAFEAKVYNDGWVQFYGRFQDTSNYYSFRYDGSSSSYELAKNVAGSSTVITTASADYEAHGWTTYKFAFEGSTIRCYVDGKMIIEETDSSFTQGKIGLRQKWGVLGLDDVVVTRTDSGETVKSEDPTVLADWKFSDNYAKSGTSLEDRSLVLEDVSGNGNDLQLVTVGDLEENTLSWSDDDYYDSDQEGSLKLENDTNDTTREGQYFRTVDSAPINIENFEEGFTIEVMYQLPETFLRDKHKWMKILYREGYGESWVGSDFDESLYELAISNLKEIQNFYFATNRTSIGNEATSWSYSLDSADDWYHIAIVNDGSTTKLYLNGVENVGGASGVLEGIKAVIGNNWDIGAKRTGPDSAKRFLAGKLQEIKITDRALAQEDWIASTPPDEPEYEGNNDDLSLLSSEENYNIAFIPDIQKTVRYVNDITIEQMKWIGQNQDDNNIVFTSFLGDIVDREEYEYEWFNASEALSQLDAYNAPYMVMAGNHDYGNNDVYLKYFGADKYDDRSYYHNDSPSGYSSYSIFDAGSYTYMILALDWFPDNYEEDMAWAQEVLDAHKEIPTIIQRHEILEFNTDNTTQRSARGRNLWADFVYNNDQVFMTICGHHHGAGHQVSKNAYGHDVIEMVVDYQCAYQGGNGWTRFAEFDEANNKIHFHTFSPWVESLSEEERTYIDVKNLTSPEDDFEYSIDFKTRFDFNRTPQLLYDVNCYYYPADTTVHSVSDAELMNSVYNQAYGLDPLTGNNWGYEMIGNAPHESFGRTTFTEEPFDSFLATAEKTDAIKYTFDLPNGQYWVTLGLYDLYHVYRPINISFNDTLVDEYIVHSAEKDTDGYWINSKEAKTYLAEISDGQLSILLENRNTDKDGPIINFIKIYEADVLAEKLTISDSVLSLNQGQTYQLSVDVEPEDAANSTVLWSSSDETVATVNNTGNVLAIMPGEAVITAQSSDGNATASCALTVKSVGISDIPTGLAAGKVITDKEIDLVWDLMTSAQSYKLYRSDSLDGTYTQIYSGVVNRYTDHDLDELTTYYYKVSAVNGGGESGLSEAVAVTTKSSGGSSGGGSNKHDHSNSSRPQNTTKEVIAGRRTEKVDGKTVETMTVDAKAIKEKIGKENGAKVTIPGSKDADKVVGKLGADLLKEMANTGAVLEVKTDDVSYQLETSKISMETIAQAMGEETSMEDIEFTVQIAKVSDEKIKEITKAAMKNNQEIIAAPVTFDIVCKNADKEVVIDQFSGYVTRYIAIPDDVVPEHVTTGVVINSDGTFEHVPTTVEVIDGKYYARISSMTNSTYSVIYNQKSFDDLVGHWSQEAVSDMASKLIINGVSETAFEPDRNISRAEFTTILVRAMGLMRNGEGVECFEDVDSDDWFYDAVSTAKSYGLLADCESEKFNADEKITREEVMVMVANAYEAIGMDTSLTENETASLISQFLDGDAVSDDATDEVALCIKNKIVKGYNQMINPQGEITRAETAMVVSRLLEKIETIGE